jgi:curved DNA-binding protein CbpA
MPPTPDPFLTLGVSPSASDAEVRSAYRRLVQLHHPDHNNGSAESARRFEEVQEAYAEVRRVRASGGSTGASRPGSARSSRSARSAGSRGSGAAANSPPPGDSDIGSRLAAMEEELKRARDEAVRQARRAASRAQAQQGDRASDEDLGYFSTEDSFGKILSDAAAGFSERIDHATEEARDSPVTKRFADLIDELGSRLTGEPPDSHK